jgi:hypothetical protein
MKVEHVQKDDVMVILPKEKRLDASAAADFKLLRKDGFSS